MLPHPHNNTPFSDTFQAMRSCRARASHQVPAPAAIYCKACHSSKCYAHLLELDSVHSVDAMMHSDLHDENPNWHQHHRDSSQLYQGIRQRVIEDEERGSRPNVLHRLIYLAKTFTTCRPIALEVTKHGWYDRFAQAISIPVSHHSDSLYCRPHCTQIANSPAKALVGLHDEIDDNDHASDDSPSNLAMQASIGDHRQILSPPPVTSSTSSGDIVPDPRSPIVNPRTPSPKSPQVLGSHTEANNETLLGIPGPLVAPSSPLSATQSPTAASLSFAVIDEGNLSDLTDLPTEVDSPPRSSIIAIPVSPNPENLDQQISAELSSSPSSAELTTSNVTGSKLKSRLVLDFVEIPQPEWYSGKRERMPSFSRQKRKRNTGPFSSNTAGPAGPCDSDNSLSAAQEIPKQPLSKRKRKMSKGPASR